MLTVLVWMMAGTALWHFSVLAPDRFFRGILGSLAAANAGAILAGLAAAGFAIPAATGIADVLVSSGGALVALTVSWLAGSRYDPVVLDEDARGRRSFAG